MMKNTKSDHVDLLRAQWAKEQPDIKTGPMSVLGRINRIALLVDPPISSLMRAHKIDRGEFDVLASLLRAGTPFILSPTELYTYLMLSSGGLTSRLKRLEKKELIHRKRDKTDGRSQLVVLSDKGRHLTKIVFAEDMRFEAELLSKLDAKDFDRLEQGLRVLCRTLEISLILPGSNT